MAHDAARDIAPVEQIAPKAHDVVSVNLYPTTEVVQVFARAPFAIGAQETVIPWVVIEGLYLSILQLRLQARGLAVGLHGSV